MQCASSQGSLLVHDNVRADSPNATVPQRQNVVPNVRERLISIYQPIKAEFNPRDGQVEALEGLLGGRDVVLVAQTGYGKSVIFQAYPLLSGRIALIIGPLISIQDGQNQATALLHGAVPCILNSDTSSPTLCMEILAGKYTHIFLCPETAVTEHFRDMVKSETLSRMIGLMAVDEVHCAHTTNWGSFRKDYQVLHELRTMLRPGVVLFGTTATLMVEKWPEISHSIGFDRGTGPIEIRTPIDRKNVRIEVVTHKDPASVVQRALLELYKRKWHADDLIPKAIFYARHINVVERLKDCIERWLVLLKYDREVASTCVRVYHSELDPDTKRQRLQEFMEPASTVRIICATNAFSMGVDPPDVEFVVHQWSEGDDLEDVLQKLGRAARQPDLRGFYFLIADSWLAGRLPTDSVIPSLQGQKRKRSNGRSSLSQSQLVDDDESNAGSSTSEVSGSEAERMRRPAKYKKEADRRSRLPTSIYSVFNPPKNQCIRQIALSFFSVTIEPCGNCSGCSPSILPPRWPSATPHKTISKQEQAAVKQSLLTWRDTLTNRGDLSNTVLSRFPNGTAANVLTDKTMAWMVKEGRTIEAWGFEALGQWVWRYKYGDEVYKVICEALQKGSVSVFNQPIVEQRIQKEQSTPQAIDGRQPLGERSINVQIPTQLTRRGVAATRKKKAR
jgi:hypothetical protein